MTTPWPSAIAPPLAVDGSGAPVRAVHGVGAVGDDPTPPSTPSGYEDAATRNASERTARSALGATARTARDRLGDLQRRCVDAGRMADAARIEAVHGRLDRVVDRLSSPPATGRWFAAKALPADAAAWLSDVDRRLALALLELAATAAAASTTAASTAVGAAAEACDSVVAEATALLDSRRDALSAREWMPRSVPSGLAAAAPGERITTDGQAQRIVEVARFARGDVGVALADGLVLWEDRDGRRIAFEAAHTAPPGWPPPPVIELDDDTFRTAWSDDGAAIIRSLAGRRSVAAARSLLAGDAGGWLWLGRGAEGVAAWRGAGVEDGA